MKFHAEPNFKHSASEPRYFVGYLLPDSYGYTEGYRYHVQLLTEDGQGGAVVLFRGHESPMQCPEYAIPEAVFRAAFGRTGSAGDYVNSAGETVDFNGCPTA